MSTYANVDIQLTTDNEILVRSEEGEVGPEPLQLDLNEVNLTLSLIQAERTNPELILHLGQRLYQALFPTSVQILLERNRGTADRVRLRLRFDSVEMAALPWEYLHNGDGFLALDQSLSVVRYPAVRESLQPLTVSGPLRVLVILASPQNYPTFDQFALIDDLKATFSPLQIDGRLEVDIIPNVTYADLVRQLRSRPPHILHFIGYTALDRITGQPAIIVNREDRTGRRLGADSLASLLYQEDQGGTGDEGRALRLVLINDIELTQTAVKNYSIPVAQTLLYADVPAAIAMQNSLPAEVTGLFATDFYEAVAHGKPLDQAIVHSRLAIRDHDQSQSTQTVVAGEWASPVLLLHATDGRLFTPQQVKELAFNTSSKSIYGEIEKFRVQTTDRATGFFLDHLKAFIGVGFLLLLAYWLMVEEADLLLISGIAVVFAASWLLRNLYRKKLPATLDTLWRQRVILPRKGNLAGEYIEFLKEYNQLLNHPKYVWITRAIVLAIAIFAALVFDPVNTTSQAEQVDTMSQAEQVILKVVLLIFYSLVGYVLGTLLWKMIATVISSTRLSHHFDLDIRPTHPDKCGGLKALGDLYFEHAWIVLLAGFFFAGWLLLLAVSDLVVHGHTSEQYPEQISLLQMYETNCYDRETSGIPSDLGNFDQRLCSCLSSESAPSFHAPLPQILDYCLGSGQIGDVSAGEKSMLVSSALNVLQFYRWSKVYSLLLLFVCMIAIIVFVLPMMHTHRLMQKKATDYRKQAHSLAGEIIELERHLQQQATFSSDREMEVSERLQWLRQRYQDYIESPRWPFDTQVRLRFVGSLAAFAASLLISSLLPELIWRLVVGP